MIIRTNKISDNFSNHTLSTKLSLTTKERFIKLSSEEMKSPSALLRELIYLYLNDDNVRETLKNFSYQFEILELRERINYLERYLNSKNQNKLPKWEKNILK